MSRSLDPDRWKRRALKVGGALAVLGLLGLLVAASGVVPIKASSGHWPITRWFLEFSMRRSVETHALSTRVPDLTDPALVHRGAGHYASACAPCHGSPGRPPSAVTRGMTPRPPWLPEEVPHWDPAHLHYIVRHGIKFTGMPAWPTPLREDEVWDVVAFLRLLPTLDAAGYRRLALGEMAETVEAVEAVGAAETAGEQGLPNPGLARPAGPATALQADPPPGGEGADVVPRAVTESCARCHGADGLGRGVGAFPRLAGQSPVYLEAALRAYAQAARHSGVMQPVALALEDAEIEEVARWYASRPAAGGEAFASGGEEDESAALARGEQIARQGVPERKVPACVQCHGPADRPRHPLYPSLAGQPPAYLVLQLRLFADGRRGGTAFEHVMREVAHHLTPEQMWEVARWYAQVLPSDTR